VLDSPTEVQTQKSKCAQRGMSNLQLLPNTNASWQNGVNPNKCMSI
jgi:hypothetical protein